jgi:hypothetical protein
MSEKINKKFRKVLRARAHQLFNDFMDEVKVMSLRERVHLAWRILCRG